jgi:hypothetical protein
MGLIYAITFAVLVWLALWAVGMKSIDATLIALGIIMFSTAVTRVLSYLPGRGGSGGA